MKSTSTQLLTAVYRYLAESLEKKSRNFKRRWNDLVETLWLDHYGSESDPVETYLPDGGDLVLQLFV